MADARPFLNLRFIGKPPVSFISPLYSNHMVKYTRTSSIISKKKARSYGGTALFEKGKCRKIIIIALLISAAFAAGCSGIKQDNASQSEKAGQAGFEAALVSRVVDGDTVVLSDGRRVRFIGVNSPEYTTQIEPYGKEASYFTKVRLTGKTVYLEKDVSETDKYGRLLRYVWLSVPEDINDAEIRSKMFNAILVLEGYAQSNTYPPDVKYQQYLTKYNAEARKADKGLWKQDSEIQN